MSIVGPNGKPIDLSQAQLLGNDVHDYEIGEIKISSAETPERVLTQAAEQAKGFLRQQGQFGAAQQANPFQFEPAALAVFMMLATEVKRLNAEIEELKGDGGQTS